MEIPLPGEDDPRRAASNEPGGARISSGLSEATQRTVILTMSRRVCRSPRVGRLVSGKIVPVDEVHVMPCHGRHPRDEQTIRGGRLVMVHCRLGPQILAVVLIAGLGTDSVRAAAINFTGNVAQDFSTDPNAMVIPVNPAADSLGQWPSQTGNGTWVSGFNIKDIYLSYDSSSGTLYVGVNNWANASGQTAPFGQSNGDPSGTAEPWDPAHLGYGTAGSDKSIALAFAPVNSSNPSVPGTPMVIAGVPADKTKNGPGTDGFTVSTVSTAQSSGGLGYMFGTNLLNNQGNLRSIPRLLIPSSSSRSRTSTSSSTLPTDSGLRGLRARVWTGMLARPTWAGHRFRSSRLRTSRSQQPGWRGRWPAAWWPGGCADAGTGREPDVQALEPVTQRGSEHGTTSHMVFPCSLPLIFLCHTRGARGIGVHLKGKALASPPLIPLCKGGKGDRMRRRFSARNRNTIPETVHPVR